ncbi:MAG: DNA mismatch repair endonuclease MutL [Clostridia bacterium]|nr:DNA mismatch repair endonuclease MutL [Clostridia bacterium]
MNMTNRIKILDKVTANQIAAGEVIEAPNSVVKELVENSIDAGGTRIEIRVEKGGLDLITVHDNGIGMSKEDLMLAFERHATSKISAACDLAILTTLGFRGEALPSIASVACVKVISKTDAALIGWEVKLKDSNIVSIKEKGCNRGTTIEVAELFYNTPARKKYLKSPLTEMAGITDIVSKLALAHPHISFTLINNDKQILKTPGTNKLIDVITSIWGSEMSSNLICIDGAAKQIGVTGYVGKTNYHRPNRKGQLFFVNNRFVKSKLIAHGLDDGYHTLLPINRFPFGILIISIDPELIDVNIHPTKLEVKFLDSEEIQNAIAEIVSGAIQNSFNPGAHCCKQLVNFEDNPKIPDSIIRWYDKNSSADRVKEEHNPTFPAFYQANQEKAEQDAGSGRNDTWSGCQDLFNDSLFDPATVPQKTLDDMNLPRIFRPLGQLTNTYIICEGDDGLYLIDQHAAHERIIYHRLNEGQNNKISSQQLLFPITLELAPSEIDLVVEHILKLKEYGFILEHFGGNTLVIREVPQDLPKGEEKDCFYQLLELFTKESLANPMVFRDKAIILIACKTAIKAGEVLSPAEINFLLTELLNIRNYATCPHGRPTIITFSNEFLAKKFIRA